MKHEDPCLFCSVHQPHGRLERWSHEFRTVSGYLFGDKKKRWSDDHWIRTSEVMFFDPVTGHVRTRNSNYILGKPATPKVASERAQWRG